MLLDGIGRRLGPRDDRLRLHVERVGLGLNVRTDVHLLEKVAAVLDRVAQLVDVVVARDDVRREEEEQLVRLVALGVVAEEERTNERNAAG